MAELETADKTKGLDARKLASSGTIGTVSPHYGEGAWLSWALPAFMLVLVIGLAAAAIWLLLDGWGSLPFVNPEPAPAAVATSTEEPSVVAPTATSAAPPTPTPTATATPTATPTATATSQPTATPTPTATATPEPLTYTVVSGDSLGAIARDHGVALADLIAVNGIENPSRISVGQVLIIPGPGALVPTATAAAEAPTAAAPETAGTPSPTAAQAEATPAAETPEAELTPTPTT